MYEAILFHNKYSHCIRTVETDCILSLLKVNALYRHTCFGHTHKPYHRILPTDQTENKHYRHAINIGSVGKPKDKNPKGCYVLLTINEESSISNKAAVSVEFIRFKYDVEKAAKAVEDSPLPNEYADMLRKGY